MVFRETSLFIGVNRGYINLRKWVGVSEVSVIIGWGHRCWGMLYLCEEEFQVLACWTCPFKERGSLTCDLATRLQDSSSGGGGGHKAPVHWDILVPTKEEAVLESAGLQM